MCISVHFIGGAFVLLNIADIGDHGFDGKSLECILNRMATYYYTVVFSITLVWIPAFIIGACNLKIYLYLKAHGKRMRQSSIMTQHKGLKLTKTLFIISVVFITCWVPYAILIVADINNTFAHEIHVYITMFAHLHPSLNWLIYYLTNKNFATGYKQLFRKCRLCCTHVSQDQDLSMNPSEDMVAPAGHNDPALQISTIILSDELKRMCLDKE